MFLDSGELPRVFGKISIPNNCYYHSNDKKSCIEYLYDDVGVYVNNISHRDYPVSSVETSGIVDVSELFGSCALYYDVGKKVSLEDFYSESGKWYLTSFAGSEIQSEITPSSHHEYAIDKMLDSVGRKPFSDSAIKFASDYSKVFGRLNAKPLVGVNGIQNYEPFTITSRPTNHWNKHNWASLSDRDLVYVDKGYLVYLDIKGCHLSLLSEWVGWKYEGHPYDYLMKESKWKGDRDGFKKSMFSFLYNDGRLPDSDFFRKYSKWKGRFKRTIDAYGYIETPIYKRKIQIDPEWKLEKCINLLMQAYETEFQVSILCSNEDVLDKIVYYLYDGILFHVDDNNYQETLEFIDSLKTIYSQRGMHVTVSTGKVFSNLEEQ